MARLSTHVLDTSAGRPAAGIAIALYRLVGNARELVARAVTNSDGRTDEPLMSGERLKTGDYELVFAVGEYFAGSNFLSDVPVRFTITDAAGAYHVPLLISPFGYTTYRGS